MDDVTIYKKPSIITGVQSGDHKAEETNLSLKNPPKVPQGGRTVARSWIPEPVEESASTSPTQPRDNKGTGQVTPRGRGRGKGITKEKKTNKQS